MLVNDFIARYAIMGISIIKGAYELFNLPDPEKTCRRP